VLPVEPQTVRFDFDAPKLKEAHWTRDKNFRDVLVHLHEWHEHQSTPYDNAVAMLREHHGKVMALIEGLSGEELFEKNHFPWTGTSTLGSYCVSATASHYDWAMKKIKQYGKVKQ
jgi:hypothetical protein